MKTKSSYLTCPTCGKKFTINPVPKSMPFCCDRCQLIDLGRWVEEEIGLPYEPTDGGPDMEERSNMREIRFD
ncbi:MAG: DNA gyrase inhibitor YacG [Planctomycetota bacterium]|nr:DNA gyrase inhibitor YacG [Planctomycetota bacterium]